MNGFQENKVKIESIESSSGSFITASVQEGKGSSEQILVDVRQQRESFLNKPIQLMSRASFPYLPPTFFAFNLIRMRKNFLAFLFLIAETFVTSKKGKSITSWGLILLRNLCAIVAIPAATVYMRLCVICCFFSHCRSPSSTSAVQLQRIAYLFTLLCFLNVYSIEQPDIFRHHDTQPMKTLQQ